MLTLKTSLLLFLCLFTLLDSLPTANAWGKPLPQGRHLKSYYKRRHLLSPRQSGSVPVPIDCSAVCPDPDMKGNPFAGNICTTGQGGKVHQFECDYTQKSEFFFKVLNYVMWY